MPVLDSPWLNHWKWLAPDPIHGSQSFCQTERACTVFCGQTSCPNSVT